MLWYNSPGTTGPGADFITHVVGTVGKKGGVNQSALDWSAYKGDGVVRFEYAPASTS